ncbi:membrane protein YdfJ [Pullulanibacillus pueri]|uniref:Membrane protein YdfJ n=1 Tax=Pullulanibacillus pueri TaxID=1437324 RepID=A0A8J2ZWD6_9BACL|nr:MMPL family transporter [Pullulanibacillus pueri]MBM7682814.1 membrane protein YdfJ [Pullulanibacillus pueri]GGH83290.1 membrane protein YdfJ [Pullulanibacillus pueri]
MAKLLYKLGKWAVDHKKSVFGTTIGILIILAIFAGTLGPKFNEDMSIPGSESVKAMTIINKEFSSGQGSSGAQTQIIFKAPKDKTLTSTSVNTSISKALETIQKNKAVASVAAPSQLKNLTQDQKIGYAVVTFKDQAPDVSDASKDIILDNVKKIRDAGIQAELSGDIDFSKSSSGSTEAIGIIVALIILSITFLSFLVGIMPILTSVFGLGISLLLILLGSRVIDMPSVSLTLAAMLGLAVGIDYSLFILNRFRKQLSEGHSVKEAIAIANGTSGSAVVFAGLTVIIAMVGLCVVNIPFLTIMGLGAALSVFFAVLVAVIFVPAVLAMFGNKLGPDRKNRFLQWVTFSRKRKPNSNSKSNAWGRFVTKRPLLKALLGIAILVVISLPMGHMHLGLPDDSQQPKDSTTRKAYDLFSEAYGEGYHSSLAIVLETTKETAHPKQAVSELQDTLGSLKNVQMVNPAVPNKSGNHYMISVMPKTGPNDTKTNDLVKTIRDKAKSIEKENHVKIMVTGQTAVSIDLTNSLNKAIPLFASIIVGLAFILLVVVFRSILVPLKAVLGFVLSLVASLGFVIFVIQDGHLTQLFGVSATGPILNFLPIFLIGILFGLAMDYEVFLVSRIREEYVHKGNAHKAILAGIKESGGVVTAAALIMISVFVGFMLTPDVMIKSMGMAFTFGVFFDAFIVRMTIVPAVMTLMGDAAWYLPKWLDKILPNFDIEGEAIMREVKGK